MLHPCFAIEADAVEDVTTVLRPGHASRPSNWCPSNIPQLPSLRVELLFLHECLLLLRFSIMQPSFLAAISAVVNLSTANYLRTRRQTDSSNWTTTEWSDTFKHRVIDGHARFRAILNANTDQSSSCAIGDWAITQNPRQPRDGGLVNIWSNAGLSMAEDLYSVSAQYARDAGSGQQANFSDFYDPTNGLVVTVNNTNATNLNARDVACVEDASRQESG